MTRRAGAAFALAGALLLTSCTWFDDEAAEPARFLAPGWELCGVTFGPQLPEFFFHIDQVGLVETPGGPIRVLSTDYNAYGAGVGDSDLVVDGVPVRTTSSDGRVGFAWTRGETLFDVQLPADHEAVARERLDDLVASRDARGVSTSLARHIADSERIYAGPAPAYDVGVTLDGADGEYGGTMFLAPQPASAEMLRARFSFYPEARADDGVWTYDSVAHISTARADEHTLAVPDEVVPEQVPAEDFVAALRQHVSGSVRVSVSESTRIGAMRTCDDEDDSPVGRPRDAEIADVEVREVDGGWSLRLDLSEPVEARDEQMGLVVLGDVVLGASLPGDPGTHRQIDELTVDAVLTRAEADYFAEVLRSGSS